MSSVLSWDIAQLIVAIPYNVTVQPIGPTFKAKKSKKKLPEQQISQLLRGGSLKTRVILCLLFIYCDLQLIVEEAGPSGRAV
jgi:hypothetical protein